MTVLLPGARIAPINKSRARSQTRLENSGAKATISGNNSAGSVGIWKTSLGGKFFSSLRGLPLIFQRPGMDKVQLIKNRAFNMTIKVSTVILFILILTGAAVFWPNEVRIENGLVTQKVNRPDFPITVYSEDQNETVISSVIIIPADHFNQKNIVQVFKWYSSEKEKSHVIAVRLYTSSKRANSYVPQPLSFCQEDAYYIKSRNLKREADEWFAYRRFLHIPVCSNRVILSGIYDGPWM